MRRKRLIAAVSLTVVLAGGVAFAALPRSTSNSAAAPAPVPIVAGTVAQHDVPIYLTGVGTVIAYNTVVVRSQIQGQRQVSTSRRPGRTRWRCSRRSTRRPYQAQIDQLTANRDRDQAQLANALANLDRYTSLAQKGDATPQLLDTQKAQVSQLQNAVKTHFCAIDAANIQLSYTRLTSPIVGIVGIRQVDIGNVIHPTDPNGLVVATQVEPISEISTLLETDLPEIQQQQLQTKSPLTVLADSQDAIRAGPGQAHAGQQRIPGGPARSSSRRNFPTRASALWPGELSMRLLLDTRHDGLNVRGIRRAARAAGSLCVRDQCRQLGGNPPLSRSRRSTGGSRRW